MSPHDLAGAKVALDAVSMPLTLIAAVGVMFASLAPGLLYTPVPSDRGYEHVLVAISYARLRMALATLATIVGLVAAIVQLLVRDWFAFGWSVLVVVLGAQLIVTLVVSIRRLQSVEE
ncbi:MAG: hypothetical protein ACXWNK_07920 [Vulcanimicrobiaceae bacterium]